MEYRLVLLLLLIATVARSKGDVWLNASWSTTMTSELQKAGHRVHASQSYTMANGHTIVAFCFATRYATDDDTFPMLVTFGFDERTHSLYEIDHAYVPQNAGVSSCAFSKSHVDATAVSLIYVPAGASELDTSLRAMDDHFWYVRTWSIADSGHLSVSQIQPFEDVIDDPELYTATAAHHTVAGLSEDGRLAVFGYTVGHQDKDESGQHKGVFNASVIAVSEKERDGVNWRRISSIDITGAQPDLHAYAIHKAVVWHPPGVDHYDIVAASRAWNITYAGPSEEMLLSLALNIQEGEINLLDTTPIHQSNYIGGDVSLSVHFPSRRILVTPGALQYPTIEEYHLTYAGILELRGQHKLNSSDSESHLNEAVLHLAFSPDGGHFASIVCPLHDTPNSGPGVREIRTQALLPELRFDTRKPCKMLVMQQKGVEFEHTFILEVPSSTHSFIWLRDSKRIVLSSNNNVMID